MSGRALRRTDVGFTIVELLIVIVVIGILAAITIAAYSGIQNRARAASAQSGASQAAKKVAAFAVQNSDIYPSTLADADISSSGDTTFQYSVNNTGSPRTFCVTATTQDVSFWASNASSTPTSGGCPGHGVGGVAAVTNLATMPSLEDGVATGFSGTSWVAGSGISPITASVPSDGGYSGSHYRRWTLSGTNTSIAYTVVGDYVNVVPGETVWISFYFRSSTPVNAAAALYPRNGADGTGTTGPVVPGTVGPVSAGIWQRLSMSYAVPGDSSVLSLRPALRLGTGNTSAGQNVDVDAVMITRGSTLYEFGDGNSPNWVWNGAMNGSTSTGPPL